MGRIKFEVTMILSIFFLLFFLEMCLGVKTNMQKKFEDCLVVPDVLFFPPVMPLGVEYANKIRLNGGDLVRQPLVKEQPSLRWGADATKYYTLILTDPDAPSNTNPVDREFLHWLVINIPGLRVSKGETIFEYVAPQPPAGTGLHRYVFLVYEQPGKYVFTGPRELKNRARFSTERFASERQLGVAVAGNFFFTEHDGVE